jgi:hypothetical protein
MSHQTQQLSPSHNIAYMVTVSDNQTPPVNVY